MVVFYRNIMDRARCGEINNYTQKHLETLEEWNENDKRTFREKEKEIKDYNNSNLVVDN